MKKVVGGRGEDVGGRLDIGEQLIPLLLLCSSYDWAAWPFPSVFLFYLFYIIFCYCAPPMIGLPGPSSISNADSTLHIFNFNLHSHLIILNVIFFELSAIPSIFTCYFALGFELP